MRTEFPFVLPRGYVDRKGVVRQQIYGDNPIFKNEEPSLRKMVQDMLK